MIEPLPLKSHAHGRHSPIPTETLSVINASPAFTLRSPVTSPQTQSASVVVVTHPGRGSGGGVPSQTPAEHESDAVHSSPSSQAVPLGSAALHVSLPSLHDSLQLLSPSAPGHGSPAWLLQLPPLHVSAPLQNVPSLQVVPLSADTSAGQSADAPVHVSP